jgi:hypothetical protein
MILTSSLLAQRGLPFVRSSTLSRQSGICSGQTVFMGAREDLLAAARALTDNGTALFSPAELIAQARSQGSTYSDSTLRTDIVSVMCGNAPVNHATTYRDFERVARGLYRLIPSGESAEPVPAKIRDPSNLRDRQPRLGPNAAKRSRRRW